MICTAEKNLFDSIKDSTVVVFDFETTGMSPNQGDRVIEVGAVRLEAGCIVDQFQALINPGFRLNPFVSDLTGISDDMLSKAAEASLVMAGFSKFIGTSPLVAHNSSFDKRFLVAEFERFNQPCPTVIGCSLLVARRIFPEAPNHKLGTLVDYLGLPSESCFHRALDDARMTAELWLCLVAEVSRRYGFSSVPFDLMQRLGLISKVKVTKFLHKEAQKQTGKGPC
ncbi:MAG: 3'-5' exonuclease [Geopsychrobacter sp.]|nr:3'-5' exonuclease [Geopsychrobacter sp.]